MQVSNELEFHVGIGWNMNYPFNTGDLICCGQCAANYVDSNVKVPWEDLRYIFGEIMYGGHIVEDWDRRLASAYLQKLFNEDLLESGELFPGFAAPPSSASPAQVTHSKVTTSDYYSASNMNTLFWQISGISRLQTLSYC